MDFNFIGTIWSLLPPVVAIALALKTKEVYSSLFIGIVLGAILYSMSMGTGFEGFLTHLLNDTVGTGADAKQYGLISCLSDPWNVGIIVFLVVLGSIVSLMNKAGGSAAFGRWASKHIKTKIGAQIATIILGLLIFIDDYFNCLTVGSVMRPITVRHGVTKEKLAYLIDSTAAPVCIAHIELGGCRIGFRVGRREWPGVVLSGYTVQLLRFLHHHLHVYDCRVGLRLQGHEQVRRTSAGMVRAHRRSSG